MLLSLRDGSVRSSATIGSDPVAVTLSEDGRTAYVADSAPGDVYAVSIPDLKVLWKTHTGGSPFGILVLNGRPYVSLFGTAEIVQLNPETGSVIARTSTRPHPGEIAVDEAGNVVTGESGFGVATASGIVWSADYNGSRLIRADDGQAIPLPLPVHPFWLAPGGVDQLLIAAEGESEDQDPGAVFSYDVVHGTFATLGRPRDPDQVEFALGRVFVAAHGDREVLAINGAATTRWAHGAGAVAIAPDQAVGLLVVAVNALE